VKQQKEITISRTKVYRINISKIAPLLAFAWISLGTGVSQAPPAPQQQQAHAQQNSEFPDGPGKDALLKTCSKCHSPNIVMANGQDREGWENTITKMVSLGAAGSDEDFTAILDYLVKNFPPPVVKINVNKATAAELETGLALSAKEGEAIVSYREKNGDFKSIDDLKKVPLVDPKKLDAKKDRLSF
jgi:competence protein ComEA